MTPQTTLSRPSRKNRLKSHVQPFPILSPALPLFAAWHTESGTTCSCTGYAPHSRLPQKQPSTHFLPLQSNEALFGLVLSLPAVWFQSRGCHIRQLPPSNGICSLRSCRCTAAARQVLKSPPVLVLNCRVSSQGQRATRSVQPEPG